jgi:hypothetical protein
MPQNLTETAVEPQLERSTRARPPYSDHGIHMYLEKYLDSTVISANVRRPFNPPILYLKHPNHW